MRIMSYELMRDEVLFLLNRDGAQAINQIHQAVAGYEPGRGRGADYRVSSLIRDLKEAGKLIQEGHMLCITAEGRQELAEGRQA